MNNPVPGNKLLLLSPQDSQLDNSFLQIIWANYDSIWNLAFLTCCTCNLHPKHNEAIWALASNLWANIWQGWKWPYAGDSLTHLLSKIPLCTTCKFCFHVNCPQFRNKSYDEVHQTLPYAQHHHLCVCLPDSLAIQDDKLIEYLTFLLLKFHWGSKNQHNEVSKRPTRTSRPRINLYSVNTILLPKLLISPNNS